MSRIPDFAKVAFADALTGVSPQAHLSLGSRPKVFR